MKRILHVLSVYLLAISSYANTLPEKSEIIKDMIKVNDYWIAQNPDPGNNQWARAAYFTGNMDFYKVYQKDKYLSYATMWANNNGWGLNGGVSTRHADNHCIGQIYIDLYLMEEEKDYSKIEAIATSIGYMLETDIVDDWWWIDALYMAMPVFTRLGNITDDPEFYNRMYEMYYDTKVNRSLYNSEAGLWYRDESFAPPYTTPNGLDSYWSRGNGWVFGAHARVLQLLPETDTHRDEYIETFTQMASALKECQREDGFWNVSLADPNDFGGPETSGTAFFTYGMAWGINNGLLDSTTYYPVVTKAWEALNSVAVHESGFLGYVQGVGSNPASSQPVTLNSTADFGVGAFLLAGSELVKLAQGEMPVPSTFYIDSITLQGRAQVNVYFSEDVDETTASVADNYSVDNDIEVFTAEVVASNCIQLSITPLTYGKYTLIIDGVKNSFLVDLEAGESKSFSYTGIVAVNASSYEAGSVNTPEKTLDVDLGTRWSAQGDGEWIRYDLGEIKLVTSVDMAFFNGDRRNAYFQIYLSGADEDSLMVFDGGSNGETLEFENFDFDDQKARYVTVVGYGNSSSKWNSITETRINYEIIASIEEVSNNQIEIYPNPVVGNAITVSGLFATKVDIDIVNLAGKIITSYKDLHTEGGFAKLNDLELPHGIYLLKIRDDKEGVTTKTIVF